MALKDHSVAERDKTEVKAMLAFVETPLTWSRL